MGLSEYEIRRRPLDVVEDDREVERSVRELNANLTCPICLGVLRRTMTVRSCLHRFCAACIDRSLRQGLKECPTCRAHCSSRRALHPDAGYDAMIALLYPDLDEFERLQADLVARINRSVSSASLRMSLDRAVALNASPAQKRRRSSAATSPLSLSQQQPSSAGQPGAESSSDRPTSTKRPRGETTPRFLSPSEAHGDDDNADGGDDDSLMMDEDRKSVV